MTLQFVSQRVGTYPGRLRDAPKQTTQLRSCTSYPFTTYRKVHTVITSSCHGVAAPHVTQLTPRPFTDPGRKPVRQTSTPSATSPTAALRP